jgi:hypothetical protein
VKLDRFTSPGIELRVAPGKPDVSGILYRMSLRGFGEQMPPIATKHTDPNGISAVRTWISGLQ